MRGAPWRKTKKTVRSLNSGHLEIESSRDREGTFFAQNHPQASADRHQRTGRQAGPPERYYLVVMDITKKWTMPLRNWPLTMSQLYIKFGDRLRVDEEAFIGN